MTKNKARYILFVILFVLALLCTYYASRPYKLDFFGHTEKIWAHRVNSLNEVTESIDQYPGIELDVVYDATINQLDIYHPPAPSAKLYLGEYLASIPPNKQVKLWLDIKNLNSKNAQDILLLLQTNLRKAQYNTDKVLIETAYPDALPIFTKAGFNCSFLLNQDISIKTEQQVLLIQDVLDDQPEIGISFDYRKYQIVAHYFQKRKKYVWMIDSFLEHGFLKSRSIATDATVLAILVRK